MGRGPAVARARLWVSQARENSRGSKGRHLDCGMTKLKFRIDKRFGQRQTFYQPVASPPYAGIVQTSARFASSPARRTLSSLCASCAARSSIRLSLPISSTKTKRPRPPTAARHPATRPDGSWPARTPLDSHADRTPSVLKGSVSCDRRDVSMEISRYAPWLEFCCHWSMLPPTDSVCQCLLFGPRS